MRSGTDKNFTFTINADNPIKIDNGNIITLRTIVFFFSTRYTMRYHTSRVCKILSHLSREAALDEI